MVMPKRWRKSFFGWLSLPKPHFLQAVAIASSEDLRSLRSASSRRLMMASLGEMPLTSLKRMSRSRRDILRLAQTSDTVSPDIALALIRDIARFTMLSA